MTIKDFISNLNPKSVLSGKISFKVLSNNVGKFGDKWIFWCENEKTTMHDFCNNPGIVQCMDLEIDDDIPIDVIVDAFGDKTIQFIIQAEPREGKK